MALKNVYVDLGFLNPFKKKSRELGKVPQPIVKSSMQMQSSMQLQSAMNMQPAAQVSPKKELPPISKKLLDNSLGKSENLSLPIIRKTVSQPPKIDKNRAKPEMPSSAVQSTFFSNLQGHISKEDAYIKSNLPKQVLYGNLLKEMQTFWQYQKYEVEKSNLESAVKADVAIKIKELHDLEIEWQKLQLASEKLQDELASKEILIESHVRQLKKAFKRIQMSASVGDEHAFMLSGGQKLRSMQELEDALHTMDEDTYHFHVNDAKNDFAAWIENVMQLPDLAQNMRKSKNKAHMASIIDNWRDSV